jgi:hypothetical protein
MKSPVAQFLACTAMLALVGCSQQRTVVPTPPAVAPNDNSYLDLQAGSTLNVIVPLLKSGGLQSNWQAQQINSNTFEVRADDLLGYTTLHYAVLGRNGIVSLRFETAEETREGTTVPTASAPVLPFELPRRAEHVRLVYLVRVSRADHNMAIVASKRLDSLNAFTVRLKENAAICRTDKEIFCTWVPAEVAVRAERGSQ